MSRSTAGRFDAIEDVQPHLEIRHSLNLTSAPADNVTVRLREAHN
jgi:hypothetical protein